MLVVHLAVPGSSIDFDVTFLLKVVSLCRKTVVGCC